MHRRYRNLLLLLGFYLVFGAFYMVVMYYNDPEIFRVGGFNWKVVYLDYPLKALFTLPIWWLVFLKGRNWSLQSRIVITLVLLPVWAKGWQQAYYFLVDNYTGGERISGSGEIFDVYTSSLFYCIQFGIFYAWEYYLDLRASERAKAESERLALQSELSVLKAQLNPHFLYNAFNTISASVPAGQESTRELIAQLSNMFRYQLRAARKDLVPLGEELEFIQDYLTLEKARFEDRLRVKIDVPAELHRALIPPLMLQPLVENAVRHGISPKVEGGVVALRAQKRGAYLQLFVSDTGVGLDPAKMASSKGFGLANTRRRLQLLFQKDLRIVSPFGEGGTQLEIEIPLAYVTESSPDRRRGTRSQTLTGIPS